MRWDRLASLRKSGSAVSPTLSRGLACRIYLLISFNPTPSYAGVYRTVILLPRWLTSVTVAITAFARAWAGLHWPCWILDTAACKFEKMV